MTRRPVTKLTRPNVEYSLTEHCNIRCYACAHASPLLPEKLASLEGFSRDLERLGTVFHARQLRLVGGEPLMHPDLLRFLAEARRIAIADTIVVYTNGVLLHRMPEAFWQLTDALHVSAYPGVRRRLGDEECARLCRLHDVELHIEPIATFDQTLVGRRIEDPRLVSAIYRACRTTTCHTVHEGRFYKCPMAPIMAGWLGLRNIDFASPPSDFVALHDNPSLRADLERYLASREPLAACSHCLGTSGAAVPHRQVDRAGCAAWIEEDSQPLIDDVARRLLPHDRPSALRTLTGLMKSRP